MKKVLLMLCLFTFGKANAQAPQAIAYQAVARDNSGNPLINQNISLRFSLHESTATGTVVYSETHSVVTNQLGLFNVNIGQGTPVTGTFVFTPWGYDFIWLQVEMDTSGGTSYIDMGTQQILSVPYALFANHSDSSSDNKWNALDTNIYNNNIGNVGIGTSSPNSKLTVKGSLSVGDSAAGLNSPPNGLRVDGPVLIGLQPFITSDGGFIVIDDGRVRRHSIGINYRGEIDSAITNTGLNMRITASDSVSGSKMYLRGTSDTTKIYGIEINANSQSGSNSQFIGNSMISTGGKSAIGNYCLIDDISDKGSVSIFNISATHFAIGSDGKISASDSVTGNRMNLIGSSDSAKIRGIVILPDGTGADLSGYSVNNLDSGDTGTHEVGHWIGRNATGVDVRLTATDSVTGSNIIVANDNDSTKVSGISINRAVDPDNLPGGWSTTGLFMVQTDDGWKNVKGTNLISGAPQSIIGHKLSLTGLSDSANVTGLRVFPRGNGNKYKGFSTGFLPETEDEVLITFASFKNAVGSELIVTATDSVIGSDIIVNNANDSTDVMGLRIQGGQYSTVGPCCLEWMNYSVLSTNDGWKNSIGTNLTMSAPQTLLGHYMIMTGKSDSSRISGITVIPQGTGRRFVAFKNDPYAEDATRDLPTQKTSIGNDFHIYATDSLIGSNNELHGSNDSAVVIGQRIYNKGDAKEVTGIIVTADEPSLICWKAVGLDERLTASDSVTGSRFILSGQNPGTFVQGQKINIIGQGENVGTDINITGGSSNIGMRSIANGSGSAAIFSGTGGATGMLVTNGNVGIGTSTPAGKLDVNGTAKIGVNGTTITNVIKATASTAPLTILPNTTIAQTYPVANSAIGSAVMVSPGNALNAGLVIAYSRVSAANTVEVSYRNTTAGIVNLSPGIPLFIAVVE